MDGGIGEWLAACARDPRGCIEGMERRLVAERAHVAGYELTYAALVLCIALLAMVPQVHTVMFEGPDLLAVAGGGVPSWNLAAATSFYVVHFALVGLFAGSFLVVPLLLWGTSAWDPHRVRLGSDAWRLAPWFLVVLVATLLEAPHLSYAMVATLLFRYAVVLFFGVAWLSVLRMVRAKAPDRDLQTWLSPRPLLLLLPVAAGLVGLYLLEQAIPTLDFLISWRFYAFTAAYQLCAVLVLIGFVADRVTTHAPCRVGFLGGLAMWYLAVSMLSEEVPRTPASPDVEAAWDQRFYDRLSLDPDADPVLLVALAGGGTRAAALGMLVLERLRREGRDDDILVISSVSGGSLAAVHFAHDGGDCGDDTYGWKNAFPRDIAARIGATSGEPVDVLAAWWPFHDRHVDAMFTNFDAAILKGMHFPRISRGEALAGFWNERFAWEERPDAPLLMVNTTRVDTGARVVVGFPPVPPRWFDDWNDKRRQPYESFAAQEGGAVDLATAVRMSSAFPYGLDAPLVGGEHGFRVIDGGVFDNTGVGTLAALVNGLDAAHLQALRDRGVVVVEVDAGAKPRGTGGGLLGALQDPLTATSHAAVSREVVLRKHADELMKSTLCGSDVACRTESFRHVTVSYDHSGECGDYLADDIPTAWTLGPSDTADTLGLFRCLDLGDGTPGSTGFIADLRAKETSMASYRSSGLGRAIAQAGDGPPAPPAQAEPVLVRIDAIDADFARAEGDGTFVIDRSVQAQRGKAAAAIPVNTRVRLEPVDAMKVAEPGIWVQATVVEEQPQLASPP